MAAHPRPLRPDAIIIGLGEADIARAQAEGRARRRRHVGRHGPNHFDSDDPVRTDIEAVGAELAAARAFGVGWVGGDRPDYGGDLANGYGVRSTRHLHGHLLLYPTDPPDQRIILVTGELPVYILRGWYCRGEVDTRWWRAWARYPAWYVPQAALYDLRRV